MKKAYLNWSSGKDAALSFYKIQQKSEFEIATLFTSVNSDVNRISMHGVRLELLEAQAKSIGLPLQVAELSGNVSMKTYNEVMQTETTKLKNEGIDFAVFGDIFLEDLKEYRDQQLSEIGLSGVYPLWKKDTKKLVEDFIELGFKAIVVCTNAEYLDETFCGRIIDHQFLKDLPEDVDPCGENGEFHTFVYDGPIFSEAIKFEIGEKVHRIYQKEEEGEDNCFTDEDTNWDTGFWYCDLI
ncbi:diphthine--ammonia ligase [Zunongwangia endophytica]|uniref:Diphthine--ammonia ligase n=1 Tax=Zunongwangia endophytica TaxID=1808945 RepID=A0ABV8H4C3_9FLAO|nr:diphthine--ammonia ligase [Zunongwangia endophytica]MDN3594598.1 diphthine--ammonia ligase [Zunongwangia endophytica]